MAERVDRTNAERQRRSRERRRWDRERVTAGVTLSEAAAAAEREAFAELGEADYRRFGSAVRWYVLAVDTAEYARQEWERLDRPMRDTFANGMAGIHPVLKAWEQAATQAARFAGELGLTPMSAARLGRLGVRRGPGRPVGANSAPDRRDSLPAPIQWNDRPGMVLVTGGSKHADGGGVDAAAIDRARGPCGRRVKCSKAAGEAKPRTAAW